MTVKCSKNAKHKSKMPQKYYKNAQNMPQKIPPNVRKSGTTMVVKCA